MRTFWGYLLHHTVEYDVLCKAIRRMDRAIKQVRGSMPRECWLVAVCCRAE